MFNIFKNFTEKTAGFTHEPYIPDKGELILGLFRNIPISHSIFTSIGVKDITITDSKMVISLRPGGGYPGYEFYFNQNNKTSFSTLSSTINAVEIKKDGIVIKSKGYYSVTRIHITGEKKEELFNLLQSGFKN